MEAGLTEKQEKFCQAIVSGMSQSDAYRAAYACKNATDASVNQMASKLAANIKVISRVDILRAPVVQKLQYGLEQAMLEAADAFAVSKAKEQGGAMVAAVQLRAKLNGLLIDRAEIKHSPVENAATDVLVQMRRDLEAAAKLH